MPKLGNPTEKNFLGSNGKGIEFELGVRSYRDGRKTKGYWSLDIWYRRYEQLVLLN